MKNFDSDVKDLLEKYEDKFIFCLCCLFIDIFITLCFLSVLVFFDKVSNENYTLQILLFGLIIYIIFGITFTMLILNDYNDRDYKFLLIDCDNLIDTFIGLNDDIVIEKDFYVLRKRKIEFINEYLKVYDKFRSILSSIISTFIATILLSSGAFIIKNWYEQQTQWSIENFVGVYLISMLSLLIVHIIMINRKTKLKYIFIKVLRQIKLNSFHNSI